jgi:SAM-dependent methyltransferase
MPNNEFGDFQTPLALARRVVDVLPRRGWTRILEPTCGTGNFLRASASAYPDAQVIGIELQPGYAGQARATGAEVITGDIFTMDLAGQISWMAQGPMLVVGNPPWVTNAWLSVMQSGNRPERVNLKNLSGYDAMTGSSNFDIAEYIWLKLLTELTEFAPTVSLLCKTQVARNVLEYCAQFQLPVSSATLHMIDAKKWFNAAVDACLFTVELGTGPAAYECAVYQSLDATRAARRFGVVGGKLVADAGAYAGASAFEGVCPLEWRQGMKHDAAAVMELVRTGDGPVTRAGERVDVEESHLYPLLKCTDLYRDRLHPGRCVIVPQRVLNDDTSALVRSAPKLWAYLSAHADVLDRRKSSIYLGRPRFCVFGLGEYSFAPYKVAVSGLHKSAEFRLVGPADGKPVFFDDACYFLPFDDAGQAAVVAALLRAEPARDFFRALAFWDAKRPITKKLLRRLDLRAVLAHAGERAIASDAELSLGQLGAGVSPDTIRTTIASLSNRWAAA